MTDWVIKRFLVNDTDKDTVNCSVIFLVFENQTDGYLIRQVTEPIFGFQKPNE